MKILKVLIFIFIFSFYNFLLNAEINNLNYYNKLLQKLKSEKNPSLQTSLEISLIYKIINLIKNKNNINYHLKIKNIKNGKEFVDKFIEFIHVYSNYLKDLDQYKEKQKRLQLLKTQLSNMDNKSDEFLITKLQYDFYFLNLKLLNSKIEYITKNYTKWLNIFLNKLNDIKFENLNIKLIKNLQQKLKENVLTIEKLQIELERVQLLNKSEVINKIKKSINYYKKKNQSIAQNVIKIYLNSFFKSLKNKNNQKIFTLRRDIENIVNEYFIDPYYIKSFNLLIEKLVKLKLGSQAVLIHNTQNTLKNSISYIYYLLKKPIFTINNKGISCLSIIFAIIVFIIGIFIGILYKKYIKKLTSQGINITPSTQTLISNIGYYLIIIIAFLSTLKVLGINLTSLTIIVGALSVGIGFGLQSVISNFICGLIMMFEKSIKIGDIIELDENLVGKVLSINMRATIINTFDNIDVIIPNQTLFTSNVINWTMSDDIRRLKIPFSVAYGTEIKKVEEVILNELFNSNLDFIRDDERRKPKIVMTEMSESSINFELFVWVHIDKNKSKKILTSEFLKLIYNTLYKHKIEIPFPQLDIHVKDKLIIKKEDEENGRNKKMD